MCELDVAKLADFEFGSEVGEFGNVGFEALVE